MREKIRLFLIYGWGFLLISGVLFIAGHYVFNLWF